MLYHGRYIIMMMGMFASYSGFLYNEIYSKGVDIFGSSWIMPINNLTLVQVQVVRVVLIEPHSSLQI